MRIVLYSRPRIIQIIFDGSAQALTNEKDAAVVVRVRNHHGTNEETPRSGSCGDEGSKSKGFLVVWSRIVLSIERRISFVVPVGARRINESSFGVCYNRIPRRFP